MRTVLAVIALVLSPIVGAKTISTPSTTPVIVDGQMGKRVCYYQDQTYSEGAVLQVGEIYMACQKSNNFETNGALKWVQLDTTPKKGSDQ